jgi:ketosteroid isomerase-like protein
MLPVAKTDRTFLLPDARVIMHSWRMGLAARGIDMKLFRVANAVSACLALCVLTGCGPGTNASAPADKAAAVDLRAVAAEVKAAIKTQVDAYAARDPVKAASIASADMLGMFHGEPNVVGKDAVLGQIREQMSDPALKLEVSDETVDVAASGELAVYHAIYHFTFTNPADKQPMVEVGNWVAVFTRQPDGAMKMSKDMVLDMPAPAGGAR